MVEFDLWLYQFDWSEPCRDPQQYKIQHAVYMHEAAKLWIPASNGIHIYSCHAPTFSGRGAPYPNAPSAKRAIFTLSQHSSAYSAAITMSSANFDIDLRVEEAAQYLRNNPKAKKRAVAKKFNVPRDRVRRRLSGVQPKKGRHASNAWLTEPEEVALCRYIDLLDRMNLSIRKEFIKDAANLQILRERTEAATPPSVGPMQAWKSIVSIDSEPGSI